MRRTMITAVLALVFPLLFAVPALADAPNFGEAIYADGEAWGTKGNATLPAPTENNQQSFDTLYVFTNGAEGQLAVSEAGPGNPEYNGGRWAVVNVTWDSPDDAVLITSQEQLMEHLDEVTVVDAHTYFQCPLLPVKA